MKRQRTIMGMPVTINVTDKNAVDEAINEVFSYFHYIDKKFSTYKTDSEISLINRGELPKENRSLEMRKILRLCEETKKETHGYFDINIKGIIDPSGLVKGYAIFEGTKILKRKGYKNFYVEIAGDIQAEGLNEEGKKWKVGIQNPFNLKEIIKIINLTNKGVATSGTYLRGKHINNPKKNAEADEIISITVIGPNVYEADRFATAAFAMGKKGINFIEGLKGFEGYMVKKDKSAVSTSGFSRYTN